MPNADHELVDIVDHCNRAIRVATRAEMRAKRLPHRCTYVLVFNQVGELFIHLRTDTKDVFPSHWDVTIGGVLAAGESYDDGVRREVAEELGIHTSSIHAEFPFFYSDQNNTVHGMVYSIQHDGPFQLQPEEIVRGEFLPLEVVQQRAGTLPFCPDGLEVLKEYISTRRKPTRA